jgi:hypothetical protein
MPLIGAREAAKRRRPLKERWHALNKELRTNTKELLRLAKTGEYPGRRAFLLDRNDSLRKRMQTLEQEFEKYIVYGERIDTPIN